MAKFWALHHYDQYMGENGRKHLATSCIVRNIVKIFGPGGQEIGRAKYII